MRIIITRWGLDSYLEHRASGLFSRELYRERLRPDILRLRQLPEDPWFRDSRHWGPARGAGDGGWKMKWHNFGTGRVQFRLCHAYIKTAPTQDQRMILRLKDRIRLIRAGTFDVRGEL